SLAIVRLWGLLLMRFCPGSARVLSPARSSCNILFMASAFMFATGIENSAPTIENGRVRVDEMESCGHYQHWKTDFDAVQDLGLCFLRYGVPLHRAFLGPQQYDWSFADV